MLQADTQMTYAQNNGIPSRTSVLKDADAGGGQPVLPGPAPMRSKRPPALAAAHRPVERGGERSYGTELNAALVRPEVGSRMRPRSASSQVRALMAGAGYPTKQ